MDKSYANLSMSELHELLMKLADEPKGAQFIHYIGCDQGAIPHPGQDFVSAKSVNASQSYAVYKCKGMGLIQIEWWEDYIPDPHDDAKEFWSGGA